MSDIITALLIVLGSVFTFISALGLLRMPDIYMRMHAATKAGTLGTGLILAALAVFFGDLGGVVEAATVILFLLITAPVAAHILGRVAYLSGTELWERTELDEYAQYAKEVTSTQIEAQKSKLKNRRKKQSS